MRGSGRGHRGAGGFSLVELAIVVVIIGVIGAIAIPRMTEMTSRSREAQVLQTVKVVQTRIEEEYAYARAYPATPLRAWFRGGEIMNSLFPGVTASIETQSSPGVNHPAAVTSTGATPTFWYNRADGVFRARVPVQTTRPAAVAMYARVNGVAKSDLGTGEGETGQQVIAPTDAE